MRKIVYSIAIILVLAVAIVLFAGQFARSKLIVSHPAPGRLIDIGGHRLHLNCRGEGSPVVLLEAGAGNFSLAWSRIQPEVALATKVCSYDRAGFGWSDPGPHPRTVQAMVNELHLALQAADVEGPYILVGHSFGGLLTRLFAKQHPREVAGMVLVDSAHEQQEQRFPVNVQTELTGSASATRKRFIFLEYLALSGLIALAPEHVPALPALKEKEVDTYQALLASKPEFFATAAAEIAMIEQNLAFIRKQEISTLGAMPLVVLSHGKSDILPTGLKVSALEYQQTEEVWQQLQKELVSLSPLGRHVVVKGSGHFIQLEKPAVVADAIVQVVNRARSIQTGKSQRNQPYRPSTLGLTRNGK